MNFALLCHAQAWEISMKMQISTAAKQTFRREKNKIVRGAEKLGKQKKQAGNTNFNSAPNTH